MANEEKNTEAPAQDKRTKIGVVVSNKMEKTVVVAVENLVFAKAWKEAGNATPPAFHGVSYDTMIDDPTTKIDEAHMFEPHYDRHVWLYRDNPNGLFAQFNPNVSCKAHKSGGHQHAPPPPSE